MGSRKRNGPIASRDTLSGGFDVAMSLPLPAPTARDHAIRFSRDVLTPSDVNTPVAKLHPAYLGWCWSNDPREIGLELVGLFDRSGIEIVDVDGTRYLARARIKTDDRTLGHLTTIGVPN